MGACCLLGLWWLTVVETTDSKLHADLGSRWILWVLVLDQHRSSLVVVCFQIDGHISNAKEPLFFMSESLLFLNCAMEICPFARVYAFLSFIYSQFPFIYCSFKMIQITWVGSLGWSALCLLAFLPFSSVTERLKRNEKAGRETLVKERQERKSR